MQRDPLTDQVIGCAVEVHRHLGPGLLESVYSKCLAQELRLQKIQFDKEAPLPICYKGIILEDAYRVDFLIEDRLILELKSVEEISPLHMAQLLSYLKLSQKSTGLILNFNVPLLKQGIKRLVL